MRFVLSRHNWEMKTVSSGTKAALINAQLLKTHRENFATQTGHWTRQICSFNFSALTASRKNLTAINRILVVGSCRARNTRKMAVNRSNCTLHSPIPSRTHYGEFFRLIVYVICIWNGRVNERWYFNNDRRA